MDNPAVKYEKSDSFESDEECRKSTESQIAPAKRHIEKDRYGKKNENDPHCRKITCLKSSFKVFHNNEYSYSRKNYDIGYYFFFDIYHRNYDRYDYKNS